MPMITQSKSVAEKRIKPNRLSFHDPSPTHLADIQMEGQELYQLWTWLSSTGLQSLATGQRAERQAPTPTSDSNCENKWQKAGKQCLVTNHGAKWIKYTSIDSITKSSMQNGSDCSQGPRMARNNLKIKSRVSVRRNPCFQNSWKKFSCQSPGCCPRPPQAGRCSDTQAPRASEKPAGLKFSAREIHIT